MSLNWPKSLYGVTAVQLSRKFEVLDRLKDMITGRGESYVEGI